MKAEELRAVLQTKKHEIVTAVREAMAGKMPDAWLLIALPSNTLEHVAFNITGLDRVYDETADRGGIVCGVVFRHPRLGYGHTIADVPDLAACRRANLDLIERLKKS